MKLKKLLSGLFIFMLAFLVGLSCVNIKAQESISLKKPSIIAVTTKKTSMKVTWNKVENAKGYQYAYKLKTAKKFKYKKTTKTTVNIKKLKNKKKYKVKVRAYTYINGKKKYSSWSKTKSVKVKKTIIKKTTATKSSTTSIKHPTNISKNTVVYITNTGKKYHKHKNCKGLSNARTITTTTFSTAVSKGLEPCKECW